MNRAMYDLEHLHNYFYARLKYWKDDLEKKQTKYDEAEVEYKKTLWYRIFKTEFKHTSKGNTSWLTGSWDFWRNHTHIPKFENALKVVNYHMKMQDKKIPWIFDDLNCQYFYDWCDENKIPY